MSEPVPLDELAAQAGRVRVAVVGGGVAGLVAAHECAKVGLAVTVFEAADRLGGTVRTVELGGLVVDTGVDCIGLQPAAAGLVDELGLAEALVEPGEQTRWVVGVGQATDAATRARRPGVPAAPLPGEAVLGIPENMFSDDCRRLLGTGGTWRAYLDRLRPPLTIGHERNLAALVRSRMGVAVLDRLVAPLTTAVYGARPDRIDVDVAAPGLNAALTRAGSLSGAVAQLRAEKPPAPLRGLVGGMSRLVTALDARLRALGADVRCGTPVTALEADGTDTGWIVHTTGEEFDTADDAVVERFDAVVVATDERAARELLAPVVPALGVRPVASVPVETVTLVVDAPALDAHPRGAEAIALPGSRAAASVVHLTAKWGGAGRHAVRVAFGGPDTVPATAALDDAAAAELARAEASVLLGVELPAPVAADRARFTLAPARALTGHEAAATRVRNAVEAMPRLAATGAWLSGSGLAQVVPDAAATADRLRRRALFGADAAS